MLIQAPFAILGSVVKGVKARVVTAQIWWRAIFLCMVRTHYA